MSEGKDERAARLAADRERRRRRERVPDLSRQDNTLIGTTADEILSQVRAYLAPFTSEGAAPATFSEAWDDGKALAEAVARLDSWMSRGYAPPDAWAPGGTRFIRQFTGRLISELNVALTTAQRLDSELRERAL